MMTKFAGCIAGILLMGSSIKAQKTDAEINGNSSGNNNGPMVVKVLKPINTTSDTVQITALGAPSFIVSNTADGSYNTYKHSQKIVIPVSTTSKSTKYQFVFYGQNDNIVYSVATESGLTTVFFPTFMYDDIREKLEQALNQRKKAELRIIQKKDGFREASLVF